MNYPKGSRIFVGNLNTSHLSDRKIIELFSKYGTIRESIVKRNFGFFQYDTAEIAVAAQVGENGKSLDGMRMDVQIADEDKHPRYSKRERLERERLERQRATGSGSGSPPRPDRGYDARRPRSDYQSQPSSIRRKLERYPRNRDDGHLMLSPDQLLCDLYILGLHTHGNYADMLEHKISGCGYIVRTILLEKDDRLAPKLAQSRDELIPVYVTVGKKNESSKTVSLNVLQDGQEDYDAWRGATIDEMEHILLRRTRETCPEALAPRRNAPPPSYHRPPSPVRDGGRSSYDSRGNYYPSPAPPPMPPPQDYSGAPPMYPNVGVNPTIATLLETIGKTQVQQQPPQQPQQPQPQQSGQGTTAVLSNLLGMLKQVNNVPQAYPPPPQAQPVHEQPPAASPQQLNALLSRFTTAGVPASNPTPATNAPPAASHASAVAPPSNGQTAALQSLLAKLKQQQPR